MINLVIVIPVFQHSKALEKSFLNLDKLQLPVIVVNDGSDMRESNSIRRSCRRDNVYLYERKTNGGKGAAVIDGLKAAQVKGFTHAFQIDADGQHDLSSIPGFIGFAEQNPNAMILGYPRFDDSIPKSRRLARYLTHVWIWINTLAFQVRDSMCGFRIYPISPILDIIEKSRIGRHMDFDPELCVRACWRGMMIINQPVNVVYPTDGKSNFRIKEDNMLLTLMHARLFFGMLVRAPWLILSRICKCKSINMASI